MQEGYSLSFRTDTGSLVDQADSGFAAAAEGCVDVVHGKAYVMDAGTTAADELSHRCILTLRFQQLDETVAGAQSGDARTIRIAHFNFRQPQYLTVKRKLVGDRLESDSDVRDSCSFRGPWLH